MVSNVLVNCFLLCIQQAYMYQYVLHFFCSIFFPPKKHEAKGCRDWRCLKTKDRQVPKRLEFFIPNKEFQTSLFCPPFSWKLQTNHPKSPVAKVHGGLNIGKNPGKTSSCGAQIEHNTLCGTMSQSVSNSKMPHNSAACVRLVDSPAASIQQDLVETSLI